MRLAFVLPSGEFYSRQWTGAIATITRHLAAELTSAGHHAIVLTPDDGAQTYAEGAVVRLAYGPARRTTWRVLTQKVDGVVARIMRLGSAERRRYVMAVLNALTGLPAAPHAVVVANDPALALRLSEAGLPTRIVLWLHNRLEGNEAQALEALPDSVVIIAVSEAVARWTQERYSLKPEVGVVYSGVDSEEFVPRSDWLAPREPVRVVCHGRIDPNKGHESAALAVALLRHEGHPVEFTLVGEVRTFGYTRQAEEAYRRELATAVRESHGRHLGWMPHSQLAGELREHDIACVLSRVDEPFGLVTLEAMASGCAVVATAVGGIPEAAGDAALFAPVDDPSGVADVLRALISDPQELARRKQLGRARAERFPWSATARGLVRILS